MSLSEQRFYAAVNVIRGLPKNGESKLELKFLWFTKRKAIRVQPEISIGGSLGYHFIFPPILYRSTPNIDGLIKFPISNSLRNNSLNKLYLILHYSIVG